jgi:hypothetical protein
VSKATLLVIGAVVAACVAAVLTVTSMTNARIELPPSISKASSPGADPPIAATPPAVPPLAGAAQPVPPAVVSTPNPARATPEPAPRAPRVERTWRDVTMDDVSVNLVFVDLPPDHGIVAPINAAYRPSEDVECIRRALATWPPAAVDDVVQRFRNVLLLAAVPDLLRLDIERDVPIVVFDHLQKKTPKDELIKVLYWIATHRSEGDLAALDHLAAACLDVAPPDDTDELRDRVGIYAMKLLGRLIGKIK